MKIDIYFDTEEQKVKFKIDGKVRDDIKTAVLNSEHGKYRLDDGEHIEIDDKYVEIEYGVLTLC